VADVAALIGTGGLGLACARRVGVGRRLILGDSNPEQLEASAAALATDGFQASHFLIDISDPRSVAQFAQECGNAGTFRTLVLAAGLSPHMGSPERIFAVNMLGAVHVLDAFLPLAVQGSAAAVIVSNAGNLAPVPAEVERTLALAPVGDLMAAARQVKGWDSGLGAYWLSKRANQLRVEAEAAKWGKRGARIVSISPGIISTRMTSFERAQGSQIDEAVAATPVGRIGVAEDIAGAVAWATSPEASFVTGIDIRVDGGMIAALRWTDYETQDPTR
jgi:NAD(P)-dependent dehydrogenase (short-subunit alcohol dehydrogenase family)